MLVFTPCRGHPHHGYFPVRGNMTARKSRTHYAARKSRRITSLYSGFFGRHKYHSTPSSHVLACILEDLLFFEMESLLDTGLRRRLLVFFCIHRGCLFVFVICSLLLVSQSHEYGNLPQSYQVEVTLAQRVPSSETGFLHHNTVGLAIWKIRAENSWGTKP